MKRQGFTIVEMLVAVALTMFLMAIISQAFVTGLETFRQLKAVGDMQENLRTAVMNLRADLQLDHFEGKRRLSDPAWGTVGIPGFREGFFTVYQGAASSSQDGVDSDGIPSYTSTNHILNFSGRARGNRPQNFFFAPIPAAAAATSPLFTSGSAVFGGLATDAVYMQGTTSFNSPWAEFAYFLVKSGTTTSPKDPTSTSGTTLYQLCRAVYVVPPVTTGSSGGTAWTLNGSVAASLASSYQYVACNPDTNTPPKFLNFYSPNDLANGSQTFKLTNVTAHGGYAPVLTNVVSFQVQVIGAKNTDFVDLNSAFSTVFTGAAPWSYDSRTIVSSLGGGAASVQPQIYGLQISLRIWDQTTQQSRQITIVQDL